MSLLKTSALIGRASAKWCINVPINNYLNVPGHIIQTQFVRTESQSTFASATSGNGTTITPLQINITPKLSSSLIICQWMINGEASWNNVFFNNDCWISKLYKVRFIHKQIRVLG